MKKTTIFIIAIIVLMVVAVGFWFFSSNNNQSRENPASPMQSQQQWEEVKPMEKRDAISSIKDAMGLGTQMKCSYSLESNGSKLESVAYVEGKKYKATSSVSGKTFNSLFDGTAVYSWEEGSKSGTRLETSCLDDLKASMPQVSQGDARQGTKSPDEQFNGAADVTCSATSGVDFTVPSDVVFSDQCEIMRNSLDSIKKMQENLPANIPSGSIPGY